MRGYRHFLPLIGRFRLQPAPLIRRRTSASGSMLSSRAAELRKLKELAESLPDVRQDKIESIKKQIESGVYNVPAESVAEIIADLYAKLFRKNNPES